MDMVAAKEAKSEESSGYVTVEGARLRYVIQGRGIPCVVIGSAIFYPRIYSNELRKHFKFIFVDTRAFAPSDKPIDTREITWDTFIDDIERVRKALGFEKIAVLGHSALTYLAFEYARQYPQHTSHVILHAMSPYWNKKTTKAYEEYWEKCASKERKLIIKRNLEKLKGDLTEDVSPSKAWIMRYIAHTPIRFYDPEYDSSWLWEGVELDMEAAGLFFELARKYNVIERLPQVSAPVFIAVGRHDYGVPYYLWDDAKGMFPNLSYNLFYKSGHFPSLEEPALFDRKLIDWIKGLEKE